MSRSGLWEPLGDPLKTYQKGHLRFALHGELGAGKTQFVRGLVRGRDRPRDRFAVGSLEHAGLVEIVDAFVQVAVGDAAFDPVGIHLDAERDAA